MKFIKIFAQLFVRLALSIPVTLFGGHIFSKMWAWFVVPRFQGAPRLSLLDSVGLLITLDFPLMTLVMLFTRQQVKNESPETSDFSIDVGIALVTLILVYPMLLLTTSIWHSVIG